MTEVLGALTEILLGLGAGAGLTATGLGEGAGAATGFTGAGAGVAATGFAGAGAIGVGFDAARAVGGLARGLSTAGLDVADVALTWAVVLVDVGTCLVLDVCAVGCTAGFAGGCSTFGVSNLFVC